MKIYFIERMDIGYKSSRGTELITFNYAKWLQEHGRAVEMLFVYYIDISKDMLKTDHAKLEAKYRSIKRRTLDFVRIPTPAKGFSFVHIKNLPSGIIYFPYSPYDNLTNLILKRKDQKFILSGHCFDLETNYPLMRGFVDLFMRLAFKLNGKGIYLHATNTEQIKFMIKLGLQKQNIIYIPPYIDHRGVSLIYKKSKKLRVLHIGGLIKNSGLFVKIFDRLIQNKEFDKYEFYFVGSNQPDELLEFANKYKNVKILGRVVDSVKWKYLRYSDALVIPALEAFPAVSLEALASGPIIISRPNYAIDTLKKLGVELFLLNGGTPEEFVEAFHGVQKMKENQDDLMQIKVKNKKIFSNNFAKEKVLEQMQGMFDKIEKLSPSNT